MKHGDGADCDIAQASTDAAQKGSKMAEDAERIAKRLACAGVASRRGAEVMIAQGRVTVNGQRIDSPALNVSAKDRITLDGAPLNAPKPAKLWRYYKPTGLVTTAKDEKGRSTVFDELPEDMPRVMSVGRLDLNSEGLLLLTNDGGLKRKLELPATGWLRRYRVRVNGVPTDAAMTPLRRGIEIDGEHFQPMEVALDRQQGANAWLTIGLREGKNREIRRALSHVGLYVNRLIRVSYGPFRLDNLKPGQVEAVRSRVLREQLGEDIAPPIGAAQLKAQPKAQPKARLKTRPSPKPAAGGSAKFAPKRRRDGSKASLGRKRTE